MRLLVHAFFIILILLVTFFGVGPVLFADGSAQERTITAAVVIVLFVCVFLTYRKTITWLKKRF